MPRRILYLALAFLLALAIGFGIWQTAPPPDPIYDGKPEHVWLEDLFPWTGDTNLPDFKAIKALGPRALPQLLELAQRKPPFKIRLANFLNRRQSLIRFLVPADNTWRQNVAAMWGFYAIGTNALPAYPMLTNMLFSPRQSPGSAVSAIALAGMGSKSIPVLLQALSNQDLYVREGAAGGLGWERENISSLISPLIECLQEIHTPVCMQAFESLKMLHAPAGKMVPACMALYTNGDPHLRKLILLTFDEYGTNAQAAIPLLESATNDPDPEIRAMAPPLLNFVKTGDPMPYLKNFH